MSLCSEEFVLVTHGARSIFVSISLLIKIDVLASQLEEKVKALKKFPAIRPLRTLGLFC